LCPVFHNTINFTWDISHKDHEGRKDQEGNLRSSVLLEVHREEGVGNVE
jgi:hypothetical protein